MSVSVFLKKMFSSALPLVSAGLVLAACTTNPATGERQIAPLMSSAQEAKAGAEAHPKILKAYGGAYEDEKLGAYVAGVTARIVRATNQPSSPYRVTVLDSPIVNAFALPGGYVYVTRGLMALVNDEAELAGVIGHEIGHVAARHSAQRQTAAIGTSVLGAVLGAVVGSNAVNQVVGLGGQGFLASYSRDQEYEADMLGVRYLANAGYDPYAAADFLNSMNAQDQLESKMAGAAHDASQSNWLSSHPATPERVAAARRHAQEAGAPPAGLTRSRDVYLSAIDGMLYGDDPSEGVVRDRTFIHPVLRFSFEAPPGFTVTNAPSEVAIQGPQRSVAKFDAGRKAAGTEIGQYLANEWAQGIRIGGLERFTVNGMRAATATTKIGDYNARLVAIEFSEDRVYRFLTGTLPQSRQQYDSAMRQMVMSFRKISAAEARAVKPLRIRIVTARAGDNIGTLASRMVHSEFQADRFRVLNGLEPGQRVVAGERFKIVAD
ncbi:MAG: M48 family metalloprotease [Parvibaculum sp.]|uniref:M48 family metalloprotease n=2 Tax=Parvibaculum sp. TaxID=2024848 RepID=UPI001B2C7CA2|nr:M48 family metalloprotease [Parvibaculum sp.]MBO6633758.1 M48 family metalloprotease [Parvibaculum sp.]MBO6677012.1 M48 family metalloprotease [Parvibaculum sp.]MBO6904841.1 M48 family metalloprotease [Parvibaculum sp.]